MPPDATPSKRLTINKGINASRSLSTCNRYPSPGIEIPCLRRKQAVAIPSLQTHPGASKAVPPPHHSAGVLQQVELDKVTCLTLLLFFEWTKTPNKFLLLSKDLYMIYCVLVQPWLQAFTPPENSNRQKPERIQLPHQSFYIPLYRPYQALLQALICPETPRTRRLSPSLNCQIMTHCQCLSALRIHKISQNETKKSRKRIFFFILRRRIERLYRSRVQVAGLPCADDAAGAGLWTCEERGTRGPSQLLSIVRSSSTSVLDRGRSFLHSRALSLGGCGLMISPMNPMSHAPFLQMITLAIPCPHTPRHCPQIHSGNSPGASFTARIFKKTKKT